MRGFFTALREIPQRASGGQGSFFHLIILNSLEGTVQIRPYDRTSLQKAIADYGAVEAQAAQGEKIEPVLVSAGPIENLRRAYPNFFLDIREFVDTVEKMIPKVPAKG